MYHLSKILSGPLRATKYRFQFAIPKFGMSTSQLTSSSAFRDFNCNNIFPKFAVFVKRGRTKTNSRENEIIILKKWLRNEIRNGSGVPKVISRYKISGDILSSL